MRRAAARAIPLRVETPMNVPGLVALALVLSVAAVARGAEVVSLPPFIVDDSRGTWLYGEYPGGEVLSRCDEKTTLRIVERRVQLDRLLGEILPEYLRLQHTLPKLLILFDQRQAKTAADQTLVRVLGNAQKGASYRVLPNVRLSDQDEMVLFMIVGGAIKTEQLELSLEHIRWLLHSRVPALPAWFTTGLLSLLQDVRFENDALLLKPMGWISVSQVEELREDRQHTVALALLADLLSGVRPDGSPQSVQRRWQAQAELFVRWGLCSEERRYREPMWRLVERSARAGFSPEIFQSSLGLDISAAEQAVRAFTAVAVKVPQRFAVKEAKLAPMKLRAAKREEVLRIKGAFERLGHLFVRDVSPPVAAHYLEQARKTLAAFDRQTDDPRPWMALALCEIDGGQDAVALGLLEEAERRTTALRPRAAVELSRLRLASYLAQLRAEETLSMEQMATLLTPLFAARKQQPALPETYELMAAAWGRAPVAPRREHLEPIEEGAYLFPRRAELVWRVAELNLRHGFRVEAAAWITHGLKIAADGATRSRFEALRQRLQVAPD